VKDDHGESIDQMRSWTLTGWGISIACLHRLSRVRAYVPPHIQIQPVLPGLTLGGYYGLHYHDSPIGPYDELVVFPALVSFGGRVGCYVSHRFVNSERALSARWPSWHGPRELRRIETSREDRQWRFEMFEAGHVAFAARGRIIAPAFPFHFSVPFIDDVSGQIVWYSGLFDTEIQLTTARVIIDPESQLGRLKPGRRLFSIGFRSLRIALGDPITVTESLVRPLVRAAPAMSIQGVAQLYAERGDIPM